MEVTDLAIKYKSKYMEAEIYIKNISEIGFCEEAKRLNQELIDINESIKEENKSKSTGTCDVIGYSLNYSKGIGILDKFINEVESKYNVYVKVYNSCLSLDMKLNKDNISKDELDTYVSEMIYNMKSLIESGTLNYDMEKHIVEYLYKIAYKLIKLELIMTGDSQVYLYAINKYSRINSAYFSNLVHEDISLFDLKQDKYNLIKEKLYEIGKKGLDSSYFDLELIKLILMNTDNINFKNTIINNMNDLVDRFERNEKKICKLVDKYNQDSKETEEYRKDVNDSRRELRKRIGSFMLAVSIFGGTGYGIPKLSKLWSITDSYKKTVTTYSTLDDSVHNNGEIVFSKEDDSTIIRVYEPWKDKVIGSGKVRNYKEYDISKINLDFDNIKEYYEYGIDNYQIKPSSNVDKDDSNITLYDDEYVEVTTTRYSDNGKILREDGYKGGMIFLYFLYMIALAITTGYTNYLYIGHIIKAIKDLKDAKSEYKNISDETKEEIKVILEEIHKNQELKDRFNMLYDENKYLLDNPRELYDRVNVLEELFNIDEDKKVKKRNKNR